MGGDDLRSRLQRLEPDETQQRVANRILIEAIYQLGQAFGMVEWISIAGGGTYCPWCGGKQREGHEPECPRTAGFGHANTVLRSQGRHHIPDAGGVVRLRITNEFELAIDNDALIKRVLGHME